MLFALVTAPWEPSVLAACLSDSSTPWDENILYWAPFSNISKSTILSASLNAFDLGYKLRKNYGQLVVKDKKHWLEHKILATKIKWRRLFLNI